MFLPVTQAWAKLALWRSPVWGLSLLKLHALSSLPSCLSFSPLRILLLQASSHKGQHWI